MAAQIRHLCAPTLFLVVIGAWTVTAASGTTPIASSTFDSGGEGWRLLSTLGHNGPVIWSLTGGNPGGFIHGQDPDTSAFGFAAPAKFLGSISAAYGHPLTFDIASMLMPEQPTSWVGLRGTNGLELVCSYAAPTSVYPAWHSRSIGMSEAAGWVRVTDGQPPTYAQFSSVLSDLEGLVIGAEFVDGFTNDISGLDNVSLVPEPVTLSLLALGGLAMVHHGWRRAFFVGREGG